MSGTKCSVLGCFKIARGKSFCDMHYRRFKLYGDPLKAKRPNHGFSKTPEYKSWQKMKERCYSPKSNRYKNYGGRGITVCDSWKNSFLEFYEDMGNKPSKNSQIDREDNNGNYEPSNCRWLTPAENSQNRSITRANPDIVRDIRKRVLAGETQISLCREYNLSPNCVHSIVHKITWKNII